MSYQKRVIYFVFAIIFFGILGLLVSSKVFDYGPTGFAVVQGEFCGDGTQKDTCSVSKPYLCQDGGLIASCGACGCPFGYTCDGDTGLCNGAGSCQAGGGSCQNSCDDGQIEFLSLTSTCNIEENKDGKINLANSKNLFIDVNLKNLNSAITLSDIAVNAYIVGTDVKDGFSLLSLDPNVDFKQTIQLSIPSNIDLSKEYVLRIEITFKDSKLSAEYVSQVAGGGYIFVAKDTSITQGRLIPVGQDLLAGFEIVNNKCCIQNTNFIKATRFIDYCSSYGVCSETSKPLYCERGLLVENCGACGCTDGYVCSDLGSCVNAVSADEINKFYLQTKITDEESPLIGYSVKKFSRLAKEVQEPVVTVTPNLVNITIADVNLNLSRQDTTQKPIMSININGL